MTKYKGLTPHNDAKRNEIAKTVLMPGDPLRAKFIAEKYLKDFKLINNVRGMLAFTGYYKGKKITIMGSGMGIPSMGIYSWELFSKYNVDNIIRIGSTGAIQKSINLFDIVIGETSITNSTYHKAVTGVEKYELNCDKQLLEQTKSSWNKLNLTCNIYFGKIYCSDAFYKIEKIQKLNKQKLLDNNVLSSEMESTALYTNAQVWNKRALTILSVSDHIIVGKSINSYQRQTSFDNMVKLALDVAINI